MKDNPKPSFILTNDQREFIENLLTKNESAIKHMIRKTLGDKHGHLIEECISELCLLMCEKISVLEAHPNPAAWVIVSAKLTAFTVINNNKKGANSFPLEKAKIIGPDATFEEALYSIWLQNGAPQKLLDTLTKREKQIYQSLYIEKKTAEATARELGLTPSTVRNVKKTIKDKILDQIKKNI